MHGLRSILIFYGAKEPKEINLPILRYSVDKIKSNMKKQDYIQPTMRVVKIQQHRMLCGSPYDGLQSPVSTYDDDEDVIDNKKDIW